MEQFSNWIFNIYFLKYFLVNPPLSLTCDSDGCIVIIPLGPVIVEPALSGNISQVRSDTFKSSNILIGVANQPVAIF